MSNANIAPKSKKMTVGTLAIMNITAVVSLRFIPSEAEYGLGAIFYYTFAAIMFLVPVAFVAAELATTYPQKGGAFRWIGEAFGARWGFVGMLMTWLQVIPYFPTVLTFGAVSVAFIDVESVEHSCGLGCLSSRSFCILLECLRGTRLIYPVHKRGHSLG